MEDRKDKQIVQQVFDSSLSGIQDDPWMAQRVLNKAHEASGTGGFIVKKKMSAGLIFAIVMMLLTVTAVAAVLLSGKDFVNQFLAPMSSETEEEQWSGLLTIPDMTSALLQDFDLAVRSGSITCKSGSSRKKQFRRFRSRRSGSKAPKSEMSR